MEADLFISSGNACLFLLVIAAGTNNFDPLMKSNNCASFLKDKQMIVICKMGKFLPLKPSDSN
jgi:hypothetical protein